MSIKGKALLVLSFTGLSIILFAVLLAILFGIELAWAALMGGI